MTRAHKQTCPVAASLNEIGDMWTLLIVREALYGVTRFRDFRANTGIAKNLLANRLAQMVASGILAKYDIGTSGTRHEYRLTAKGRAMVPIMVAVSQWGNQWLFGEGREPVRLVDRKTGDPIAPLNPEDIDGNPIDWDDIAMAVGPGANEAMRNRFAKPHHKMPSPE